MAETRWKNRNWQVTPDMFGNWSWDAIHAALLMDIRDELQALNQKIGPMANTITCRNAVDIPNILRGIRRNTTKRRRKKAS
jgi:hypothetical protein